MTGFFPNQDTLPKGGFGNLIALPLQKGPRDRENSVFLDASLAPYPDQWAFLYGYFVLRFLAEDVGKNLDFVLDAIERAVISRGAGDQGYPGSGDCAHTLHRQEQRTKIADGRTQAT